MQTDAQKRAQIKYDAANTVQYHFKFNRKTDADIIDFLDKIGNKQGFIKRAIRNEMKNAGD